MFVVSGQLSAVSCQLSLVKTLNMQRFASELSAYPY